MGYYRDVRINKKGVVMAATPSDSFKFQIRDISFHIERQSLEMYPGVEGEVVTIEYSFDENRAGSGVCVKM
jgi:hypothetical protein